MKNNVQSIERAFQLLAVIHRRTSGIGISDLAEATGLHTSTVSRIISTLETVGAVERIDGSKLVIGPEIITLSDHAPLTERLISIATPTLRELMIETNEAVGLTQIEADECVVFYQLPSDHHIQIRDWTGHRFPIHVTSTGKVWFAYLDDDELTEMLDTLPLSEIAPGTKTDPAAIRAEIPHTRNSGVGWTIDELEDGLTSIAAPILDQFGAFVAGLYMSIPNYRIGNKEALADRVRAAAADISAQLGYEQEEVEPTAS